MNKNSKIYIAGHAGMVGSAIHRRLVEKGYTNFVLRTLNELDLTRQQAIMSSRYPTGQLESISSVS